MTNKEKGQANLEEGRGGSQVVVVSLKEGPGGCRAPFSLCFYFTGLGGENTPTIFGFIRFRMNGLAEVEAFWGLTEFLWGPGEKQVLRFRSG